MEEKNKKIIQSWLLAEYLTSGKLPEIDRQQALFKQPTVELRAFSQITEKHRSFIYCGIYSTAKMKQMIAEYFKEESLSYNPDQSLNYSLVIQLDEKGNYIENSLFIPESQFIFMKIFSGEKQKIALESLQQMSQSITAKIEPELQSILATALSFEALEKIQRLISKYFQQREFYEQEIYGLIDVNNQTTPQNVSNVLTAELTEVLGSPVLSPTLEKYLNGQTNYTEITDNLELINSILKINNIPDGHWPANINHKLSLMEQVAVNLILNEKKELYSINTPPGTGKSAVLKDILADIVVKRGQKMATFKDPNEAFKHQGMVNINELAVHHYELSSQLTGYGIVLAASTAEKAEKLTKELANRHEVIHSSDRFSEEDHSYSELIKELKLFPEYVGYILEDAPTEKNNKAFNDYWGLFSLPLGSQKNIDKVIQRMLTEISFENGDKTHSLYQQLKDEGFIQLNWEKACQDFAETKKDIESEKAKIKRHWEVTEQITALVEKVAQAEKVTAEAKELLAENTESLQRNKARLENLLEQKSLLPKPSWVKKLFWSLIGKKDEVLEGYNQQIIDLAKQKNLFLDVSKQLAAKIEELEYNKKMTKSELSSARHFGRTLGLHFEKNNYQILKASLEQPKLDATQQKSVPWLTKRLNYLRGKYFIQALGLHKLFNQSNSTKIYSALTVIKKRKELNLNNQEERQLLAESWKIFQLLVPVISTDLANIGNMYEGLSVGSIDYLVIDEGEKASARAAVAGIWRAKNVIVFGEQPPKEPVKTIEDIIFDHLRMIYQIDARYLSIRASVQQLADFANFYGTTKANGQRIGIPLWVQRRSLNPIFEIANQLSYEGKLVQGLPDLIAKQGQVIWLDCSGPAIKGQYVLEQSLALLEQLKITKKLESIYVTTPFIAIVKETKSFISQHASSFNYYKPEEVSHWLEQNICLVQAFEEQEATRMYFICGTDELTDQAANWTCQTARLLTIAVTATKKELLMIGDYQRFKEKPYYQVIANYTQKIITKEGNDFS